MRRRGLVLGVALLAPLAACSGADTASIDGGTATTVESTDAESSASGASGTADASESPSSSSGATDTSNSSAAATTSAATDGSFWDSSVVHSISISFDESDFDAMITTYQDTGDKEWIAGSVTIDGVTYDNVGLRLKGNSSLRGLADDRGTATVSADEPESLPWLIRLDKYVDGQNHDGTDEFVVRANNSASSLNEAVALELFGRAGLATEQAAATRFSVNDGEAVLRLTIENPDDDWQSANFSDAGILYKSEAEGDWSYRGDDPASYVDVFDQETGDDDMTPLIELLDFLNNSDDDTFTAELANHLDVEEFARYLALQELVNNSDDIDGPGNNSYLYYDATTGVFTVVNWDLNLAFGGMGGMGGGGGMGQFPGGGTGEFPGGGRPDGATVPGDGELPDGGMPSGGPGNGGFPGGGGGGGSGFRGRSNILVERFMADATFAALYEQALADLTAQLYTSGVANDVLDAWVNTLTTQASDLIDPDTVADEAAAIESQFS